VPSSATPNGTTANLSGGDTPPRIAPITGSRCAANTASSANTKYTTPRNGTPPGTGSTHRSTR